MEGLCKGTVCIPTRVPERLTDGTNITLVEFACATYQNVVVDQELKTVALGITPTLEVMSLPRLIHQILHCLTFTESKLRTVISIGGSDCCRHGPYGEAVATSCQFGSNLLTNCKALVTRLSLWHSTPKKRLCATTLWSRVARAIAVPLPKPEPEPVVKTSFCIISLASGLKINNCFGD